MSMHFLTSTFYTLRESVLSTFIYELITINGFTHETKPNKLPSYINIGFPHITHLPMPTHFKYNLYKTHHRTCAYIQQLS